MASGRALDEVTRRRPERRPPDRAHARGAGSSRACVQEPSSPPPRPCWPGRSDSPPRPTPPRAARLTPRSMSCRWAWNQDGDATVLAVGPNGAIQVRGGGPVLGCSGGDPTVANTDSIQVTDSSDDPSTPAANDGDTHVSIISPDGFRGPTKPTGFILNLNAGSSDELFIGDSGSTGDHWTLGNGGINTNALTSSTENILTSTLDKIELAAGSGNNVLSAQGGAGTGAPYDRAGSFVELRAAPGPTRSRAARTATSSTPAMATTCCAASGATICSSPAWATTSSTAGRDRTTSATGTSSPPRSRSTSARPGPRTPAPERRRSRRPRTSAAPSATTR